MKLSASKINQLTLKYYWQKAWYYKWRLSVFCICTILAVLVLHFVSVLLIKEIFDLMTANANAPEQIAPQLFWILTCIGFTFIANFIFWRSAEFINDWFQPLVMRDILRDVFDKLLQHSYSFFTNHFTGGLVSKSNRFVRSFERIADIIQFNLLKIVVVMITSIIITHSFLPIAAYLFTGWSILYVILSYYYSRFFSASFWRKNAQDDSKTTSELADSLTNIFNVKIFSAEKTEKSRFEKTITAWQKSRTVAWMTSSLMKGWQDILMTVLELIVLYLMITKWISGELTLGEIFAIQAFITLIFANLWELGRLFRDYSNALADAEEMTLIMHQTPSVLDIPHPQPSCIKQGEIVFKDVNFRYEAEKKSPQVFQNFNLTIAAGQKIGLVGESGAGKSTFVNLLLRFLEVQKGQILLDGQDINTITQNDLRGSLAYVPQEPILFHRSLHENILYGRPTATKTEVLAAAKSAHAHEFVQTFPEQYETLVGERGVKLSGGQKQRIAIARALLKSAPILVLDEATSSLDSSAEKYIQEALEKLMAHRTTLVIAHRLSTLRQMDRIIVFEHGHIVEDGTHDQLLAQKGKYAQLWEHQSGGFIA